MEGAACPAGFDCCCTEAYLRKRTSNRAFKILPCRYVDTGASGESAAGFDLSTRVVACGASAVDTSVLTGPQGAYVVTYTLTDAAGRKAVPQYR